MIKPNVVFWLFGPRFRKNLSNYFTIIWLKIAQQHALWIYFCELLYTLHELFKFPATIYYPSRSDCLHTDSMHSVLASARDYRFRSPFICCGYFRTRYLNLLKQIKKISNKIHQLIVHEDSLFFWNAKRKKHVFFRLLQMHTKKISFNLWFGECRRLFVVRFNYHGHYLLFAQSITI